MATKSTRIATRLDPEEHRQLQERAEAEGRKVANMARRLIVQGLRAAEKTAARG